MQNNELARVNPSEFGLELDQATTIEQAFLPKIQERDALVDVYNQLITSDLTPALCKQAKEVRLKLVKVRTGISDIHKTQKAFFLAAGRFVDAWKSKETLPIEQMEEKLGEIENYYVNIEKARKTQMQAERLLEVSKYTDHPAVSLGEMEQQVYDAYLQGLIFAYNAKVAAEKQAEADRIAKEKSEADERERIRVENEQLKKDNEEKEKQLAAERAKADAERKSIEAKAKMERDEAAAKLEAEQDAARIAAEKAAAEIATFKAALKAKADAEEKARKDAEAKENEAKKTKEAAEKKAANAPDKTKLIELAEAISGIALPELKGEEAQKILADVKTLLSKVKVFITEKSNTL